MDPISSELEPLLRQAVSRLTLLAEEPFPSLVTQLSRLREAVKGDAETEEVRELLQELSDKVRKLESIDETNSDTVIVARQTLESLIGELELDEINQHKIDVLSQKLAEIEKDFDLQRVTDEIAQTINRAVREPQRKAEGALLINDVLCDLLREISLPPVQQNVADRLIDTLEEKFNERDIPRYLDSIADIIASLSVELGRERRDYEHFLSQLTNNLADIERNVQLMESSRQATFHSGIELNDAVHNEMDDIQSSVDDAHSVENMKIAIRTRMATIRERMLSYRSTEEERNQELEQQVQQLTQQLQTVEQEGTRLKERVMEEHRKAMTDSLTGIANRLAYEERIQIEVARHHRYNKPLCLALWDIDRFKAINDNFGHRAGDKVLKTMAQLLRKSTRETDFFARYGGEEFILLLPETGIDEATQVAEKLREEVAACGFHFQKKPVHITISCGIAEFVTNESETEVVERADKALYQAKEQGRDRVIKG